MTDEKVIKMINEALWADSMRIRSRIDETTFAPPMQMQEDLLIRLLRDNSHTEYGRKYNFTSIQCVSDYQQRVPVTTYSDYLPYITRMIDKDEKSLLTAYRTEHFTLSSTHHRVPLTRLGVLSVNEYTLGTAIYTAEYNGYILDGFVLNLLDCQVDTLSSGATMGTVFGSMMRSRQTLYEKISVPPIDVLMSPDVIKTRHLQALHALSHEHIAYVLCNRFSDFIEIIRYIEKHWPVLSDEIEDSERARAVAEVMRVHAIGTQLVNQLWPKLRCVIVFGEHRFTSDADVVRNYSGSDVHLILTGISIPEGVVSTTLHIDDAESVLLPDSMFYEFRHLNDKSYDHLLTIDQIKAGFDYELVITNLSGFYRYRTGMNVRVVGRYHESPTVELIGSDEIG
jgi:hypothetical protein